MLEELHNHSPFLDPPIMTGSVQGKVSPGSSARVNIKAGSAVIGNKSGYLLGARFNTSTVDGHEAQRTLESEILLHLSAFRHKK